MPELPEVETARRQLVRSLTGRRVLVADAPPTRIFRPANTRKAFLQRLPGRCFEGAERRGKWLLLRFDGNVGIAAHLGMTGSYHQRRRDESASSHVRASLELDDRTVIEYRDPRLFGRIVVLDASAMDQFQEIASLGPDPLRDGIDQRRLLEAFSSSKRTIKVALLDQTLLAGIGNILATEALFRARIHPARSTASLKSREVTALVRSLDAAIQASLSTFEKDPRYLNAGGDVKNPFLIYDRAGSPCPRCRMEIEKRTIGGRTSAYCPRCQPE